MASSQTTASPRAGTSTAVPRAHATTPFQRPLRFVVRTCCRPLSFSTLAEELPSHHRIRPSLGRHDPPRSVVIARLIRAVARPPPAALLTLVPPAVSSPALQAAVARLHASSRATWPHPAAGSPDSVTAMPDLHPPSWRWESCLTRHLCHRQNCTIASRFLLLVFGRQDS